MWVTARLQNVRPHLNADPYPDPRTPSTEPTGPARPRETRTVLLLPLIRLAPDGEPRVRRLRLVVSQREPDLSS